MTGAQGGLASVKDNRPTQGDSPLRFFAHKNKTLP